MSAPYHFSTSESSSRSEGFGSADHKNQIDGHYAKLRNSRSVQAALIGALAKQGTQVDDLSQGTLQVYSSWAGDQISLSYVGQKLNERVVITNLETLAIDSASSGTTTALDVAKLILNLNPSPRPHKPAPLPSSSGLSSIPDAVHPSSVQVGREGLTFEQLFQLLQLEKADRAEERAGLYKIIDQLGNLIGLAMGGVQSLPRLPLSNPLAPVDPNNIFAGITDRVNYLKELVQQQGQEIERLTDANKQIPQLQQRIRTLENELDQARQTIQHLEQQLQTLETANEELRGHKTRLEGENRTLQETIGRLQGELQTANRTLQTTQQQLQTATTRVEQLEDQVHELQESLQTTTTALEEQRALVANLREQLRAKGSENEQLTTLLAAAQQTMDLLTEQNRKQGEELLATQTELSQAREENEQLRKTNDDLTQLLHEKTTALTRAEEQLSDLQSRLRQTEKKLEKAESRITELEGALDAQKAKVKELLAQNRTQAARIKELETALRTKDAELDRLRTSLKEQRAAASKAEPALAQATTDLKEKDRQISELESEIERLNGIIRGLKGELSKVQKSEAGVSSQLRKAEAANESIPQLQEQLEANDSAKRELEETLRKTQDELQELRTQFNDAAAERDLRRTQVDSLTSQLRDANQRAERAERSLKELSGQMDALKRAQDAALESKDKEIERLKKQLAELQAQGRNSSADAATIASLQQQLKAAEEAAKTSVARLVASQEQDINRRVSTAIQTQQSRIAALEAQLTTLKGKVADSSRLTQLERTLAAKEREIDELKRKHEQDLGELRTKNGTLVAENAEQVRQLAQMKVQLEQFEELQRIVYSLQSQRESYEQRIKALQDELLKAQVDAARLAALEEENARLRDNLQNLEQLQAQMPPGNKDLEERLSQLQQTIAEKDEEIDQLKRQLEAENLGNYRPPSAEEIELQNELLRTQLRKEIEADLEAEYSSELSNLNSQVQTLLAKLEQQEKTLADNETTIKELKAVKSKQSSRIHNLLEENVNLTRDLGNKSSVLEEVQKEIEALRNQSGKQNLTADQRRLLSSTQELEQQIQSIKSDLEASLKNLEAKEARIKELERGNKSATAGILELEEQSLNDQRNAKRVSDNLEKIKEQRAKAQVKAKATKKALETQIAMLSDQLEKATAVSDRQSRQIENQKMASSGLEEDNRTLREQLQQAALIGQNLLEQVESLQDQLAAKTSLEITEVSGKDVRSKSPDASSGLGAGNVHQRGPIFVIADREDLVSELDEDELDRTLDKLTQEEAAAADRASIDDAYNNLTRSVAELEAQQKRNYQGLDQSISQAQNTISVMRSSLKEKSNGDADDPADLND